MGTSIAQIAALQNEEYRKKGLVSKLAWDSTKWMTPMWAAMKSKKDKGFGLGHIVKLQTQNNAAIGPVFADVQTFSQSTAVGAQNKYERFVVTSTTGDDDFNGVITHNRKALDEAENIGNVGAVSNLLMSEKNAQMEMTFQRFMLMAAGRGFGRAATILAAPNASPAYVEVDITLMKFLPVGTPLVAAEFETTGALRGSGASLTVTGHTPDYANRRCKLLLSGNPTTPSWAINDTLFFKGYRQDTASPTAIVPVGIGEWNPFTAATTSLYGLARTGRIDLQGLQIDCSTAGFTTMLDALYGITDFHTTSGRTLDAIFVNRYAVTALAKSQQANALTKVNTEIGPYKIGFKGFGIQVGNREIPILVDDTLESGQARLGPWNDAEKGPYIVMPTNLDLINLDDRAGALHILPNSPNYQQRHYSNFQFVFPSPADYMAVTSLPTV
jgi:hypothetical protein